MFAIANDSRRLFSYVIKLLSAQSPGQFEEDLFETIFSIRGRFDEGEA